MRPPSGRPAGGTARARSGAVRAGQKGCPGCGQFATPTLKRHNPVTVRKNVGDTYHGCLRIDVSGSADLYRKIEGWATASMDAVGIWTLF